MDMNIADTLQLVASLRSPVVRSCHIGNNTVNVWAWLALSSNARLVQFDHTLYGVDENCVPWTVLGDQGRVFVSFSPDGHQRPEDVGGHVNDLMTTVDRRHTAHLNYGVFGKHDGEDLMLYHLRIANELSTAINGSKISWDSQELLRHRELFADIVRFSARTDRLSWLFDRWVRTNRKGHITMRRLRLLEVTADRVTAVDIDGTTVFEGTVEQLITGTIGAFEALTRRFIQGHRLPPLSYPWVTLPFAYLSAAVHEYAVDSTQCTFWHAAGSASQYYLNEEPIQQAFVALRNHLARGGFLPLGAQLRMIPTFCCQLVATSQNSLALLEDLCETWRDYLRRHQRSLASLLARLATTTDPFGVAEEHARVLPEGDARKLREAMDRFNAEDRNKLPVAHVIGRRHPNYNKYGLAQHNLRGCSIFHASSFHLLTWAETELLVKTLAHLSLERRG
jgi:hypothetical protein